MSIVSCEPWDYNTRTLISLPLIGSPSSHPQYKGTNGRGNCRIAIQLQSKGSKTFFAANFLGAILSSMWRGKYIRTGLYTSPHTQHPYTCTHAHASHKHVHTHTHIHTNVHIYSQTHIILVKPPFLYNTHTHHTHIHITHTQTHTHTHTHTQKAKAKFLAALTDYMR